MSKMIPMKISTTKLLIEFNAGSNATGKDIFEEVIRILNIREFWWFGLQYIDSKQLKSWLKFKPTVLSQDVGMNYPLEFKFCIKCYPEDVEKELIQDSTKHLFYHQIKEEILNDNIYCPPETCVLLASLACQSKYGDYKDLLVANKKEFMYYHYLIPKKVLYHHNMSVDQWIDHIVVLYKSHRNMLKEDAMMEYLKIVQDLQMYGINYFEIINERGTNLYIGVHSLGLSIYKRCDKSTPYIGFPWKELRTISYSKKMFSIKTSDKNCDDVIFYTKHTRINEMITDLTLSNCDLYMRRREVESVEIQSIRLEALELKKEKLVFQNKEDKKRVVKLEENIKYLGKCLEDYMRQTREVDSNERALEEAKKRITENKDVQKSESELLREQDELAKLLKEREDLNEKTKNLNRFEFKDESFDSELLESDNDRNKENGTTMWSATKDLKKKLYLLSQDLEITVIETNLDDTDRMYRKNERPSCSKIEIILEVSQGDIKDRINTYDTL